MTKLVTGAKLRAAVEGETFIKGGDVASVESVKYDFHMGDRVLKALYGQPKDIDTIPEESRWVDPGEAVFLLTKERLKLPHNMTAVLTPKRKLAHSGIMILGGLAVDPGYSGVLLIGLYNFSSTRYPLRPNAKLIGAMFYELDAAELEDAQQSNPAEITDFPDDLIRLIQNYRPADLKAFQDALADTQRQLENLRKDLITDKDWKDGFKNSLDEHNRQLGLLIEGLKDEKDVRRQEDERIRDRLDQVSNVFAGFRNAWVIAAIIIAALLSGIFGFVVPKIVGGHELSKQTTVVAPATLSQTPAPATVKH